MARRKGELFYEYIKVLGSNYGLMAATIGTYVVSVPLLVTWLGAERYGIWLILQQVLSLVSIVTTAIAVPVAREATSYYVSGDRQRVRSLFQTVSAYYLFAGSVLFVIASVLAMFASQFRGAAPVGEPGFGIVAILLAGYLIISTQLNLLLGILTGFQLMHVTNVLFAALAILGGGFGIAAVAMGHGILGLALGQVLAGIVVYCICTVIARRRGIAGLFGIRDFDIRVLRKLLGPGSSYLGYSLSYLLLQSDIILVALVLGPAAAATYGIAYKILDYLSQLIWRIPDSLFPLIAEVDAREEFAELKRLHRLGGTAAMAVAIPVAIMLGFYGRSAVLWWVGSNGTASQSVFGLFAVVLVLQVLVRASLIVPFATTRMSRITGIALIEGALKIGAALFLLAHVGVTGAVLATILAQVCLTGWYVPSVACKVTVDRFRSYLWQVSAPTFRPAGVALVLGVFASAIFNETAMKVLVCAPLCVAAYAVVYVRQGGHGQDLQWVTRKIWAALRRGVAVEHAG